MDGEDDTVAMPAGEAHRQFPELLRRVAAGEQVTILDESGTPIALLCDHPDRPPTEDEVREARARTTAAVRTMLRETLAAGYARPTPEILRFLDEPC